MKIESSSFSQVYLEMAVEMVHVCMCMYAYCFNARLVMVALCNRADHYIFAVISFFLSFFSPNLSGPRLDVYHTCTHGVALVRI